MSLCLHNVRLVTPQGVRHGGLLAGSDGRIEAILAGASAAGADVVVDGRGHLLFPGFIDAHVHMRDPGFRHKEDFSSGTRAAACAGITTVMCMPNTDPAVNTIAGLDGAREAGARASFVDFTLQAAAEPGNVEELWALWEAGVTSFELFMTDVSEPQRVDHPDDLIAIFTHVAGMDGVVGVLAGSQLLLERGAARARSMGHTDFSAFARARSPLSEALGIAVALEAQRATGVRLVFRQLCTARGAELVCHAKAQHGGDRIAAEVTPHHLCLDLETLARLGPFAHMLPTLQEPAHQEAIMAALIDRTIDFVASDHAPHLPEEKQVEDAWQCPGGTPGLDTLAPSVLDLACRGIITFPRVAELLAQVPADLFGLDGRKGALEVGLDADLVLVDPEARREITPQSIRSRAARSPFEGKVLQGWPVLTVLRGEIIAEDGALTVTEPGGQHLRRFRNVQAASASR